MTISRVVKKFIWPSSHSNPRPSEKVPQKVFPELPFLQSPETERPSPDFD
jgi:hypothetical protein